VRCNIACTFGQGTYPITHAFASDIGEPRAMSSSARIFFAGVGTTFVILAAGFGGGLMMAKSAVYDAPAQTRATLPPPPPVRTGLPPSAEPAPQLAAEAHPPPTPEPVPPIAQRPPESSMQSEDAKQEEARKEKDLRAERRRVAERKAKRIAAARARQLAETRDQQEPRIMAFDGGPPRLGGFFGN